jgi:hypothetical protein
MKKGVGSGVGSGSRSISQRYGSGDPDPHQNVTDPQHCPEVRVVCEYEPLPCRIRGQSCL